MSYKATASGDLTLRENITKEQIEEIIKKGKEVFDEVEFWKPNDDSCKFISIYECQENYHEDECIEFYRFVSKYIEDGYVEFTGEYDLVLKKFFYFAFTKLVPIYRNIVKKRAKKRRDK